MAVVFLDHNGPRSYCRRIGPGGTCGAFQLLLEASTMWIGPCCCFLLQWVSRIWLMLLKNSTHLRCLRPELTHTHTVTHTEWVKCSLSNKWFCSSARADSIHDVVGLDDSISFTMIPWASHALTQVHMHLHAFPGGQTVTGRDIHICIHYMSCFASVHRRGLRSTHLTLP